MNVGDKVLVLNRRGTPNKKGVAISGGGHTVNETVLIRQVAGRIPVVLPGITPNIGDTIVVSYTGKKVPVVVSVRNPCNTYISVPGIVNGDFETGLQSPWVNAFGSDHTTTIGSTYKHLGDYGCRRVFTSSTTGLNWRGLLQYDIEVQEGDYVRLWFKNITDNQASIEFYRQTAPAHHHEWSWTQLASDGWKRHCFNLSEFLEPGIFRVTLWTHANGVGVFENWWDDVEIIRAG